MTSVAGIILAAGASTRMGSPKALLEIRGETFLARIHRILRTACDPVVIVLAPGSDHWAPADAVTVINPDPSRGMLSSLQAGLAALGPETTRAMFTPLDYPAISASTVAALAACGDAQPISIPRYRGKRGHPVSISRAVIDELLALPVLTATPADVIRRDPDRICYVDVDDAGILRDIDHPHEYQEFLQSLTC